MKEETFDEIVRKIDKEVERSQVVSQVASQTAQDFFKNSDSAYFDAGPRRTNQFTDPDFRLSTYNDLSEIGPTSSQPKIMPHAP